MSRYDETCAELVARPRRWLVTGVAGFIGSALLEKLLSLGQQVVGLDNFVTGYAHNLDDVRRQVDEGSWDRFRFIEGDIRDPACCAEACQGVDYVLHQAALGSVPRSLSDPLTTHECNVDGFVHMLLAARDAEVARFVYASSSSVYGDHPALPKVEEAIGRQLSPYAVTKHVNELYAHVVQHSYGLETIGLRYFNVYGRRQDPAGAYAAVIPKWIQLLIDGEPCVIYGDGVHSRDYCYVDNAVQANLLAATGDASATGEIYNVGVRGRTDLNELFRMIRDGVARSHPAVAHAAPQYAEPRPGDVLHSQASIDKIVERLGYEPTHHIDTGLDETVDWFVRHSASRLDGGEELA